MKVLVFEYITGGGLRGECLPPGLLREGELMLRALTDDLLAIPDVLVTILRDDRLPEPPSRPGLAVIPVGGADELDAVWHEGLAAHDAVWPIAPETAGVLERICGDVERGGKVLLNTAADGVRLAASKIACIDRLARHGLPVVPTMVLPSASRASPGPSVIKPDDGVGCEDARIVDNGPYPSAEAGSKSWIVQPLIEGEAISLSALFAQGNARLLTCNRQFVERVGDGFVLRGCLVNALSDDDGRWQSLLADIARAVPELWGYAGVDLILSSKGPLILEINPRLTTSYAGVHRALGINPAGLLLNLLRSGSLPPPLAMTREAVEVCPEHCVEE